MLVVGMTGVRLGERVAQIGCAHGGRLAAVAKKAGLSGRAVAIVPDDASAERARKGAAQAGVLVEIETAPPTRLPADDSAFDLVVVDDTPGCRQQPRRSRRDRRSAVLGPGGRAIVLGNAPRGALGRLLARAPADPPFDAAPVLQANGFKSVRNLAERDGLRFVEGIRPRQA